MNFTGITTDKIAELSREASKNASDFRELQKDLKKRTFEAFGFRFTKWHSDKVGLIDSQARLVQLMEIEA